MQLRQIPLDGMWEALFAVQDTVEARRSARRLMERTANDPVARVYVLCRLSTALPILRPSIEASVASNTRARLRCFWNGPEVQEAAITHDAFRLDVGPYIKRCEFAWNVS